MKSNRIKDNSKSDLIKDISGPLTYKELIIAQRKYNETLSCYPIPLHKYKDLPVRKTLYILKRKKYNIGPYKNITIFEAANRIATDLTMLQGIKCLMEKNPHLKRALVIIRLGIKHEKEKGDFTFHFANGKTEEGESFDVASSLFKNKLNKTLMKWKGSRKLKFLIFNKDAIEDAKCSAYLRTKVKNYRNLTIEQVDD